MAQQTDVWKADSPAEVLLFSAILGSGGKSCIFTEELALAVGLSRGASCCLRSPTLGRGWEREAQGSGPPSPLPPTEVSHEVRMSGAPKEEKDQCGWSRVS